MRVLRHVLQAVLLVVTIAIAIAAGLLVVSQTGFFRTWLRDTAERQGNRYLNGRLSIGGLRGNILSHVELNDVQVQANGRPAIAVKNIQVAYDLLQLLTKRFGVSSLRLERPVVQLERGPGGGLNLARLLRPRPSSGKSPTPFAVNDVTIVDGEVSLPSRPVGTSGRTGAVRVPDRIDAIDARLSFSRTASGYTADVDRLSLRARSPSLDLQDLSGTVAVRHGDLAVDGLSIRTADSSMRVSGTVRNYTRKPLFDLRVDAGDVDFAEIGRLIPALSRYELRPSLDVDLTGPPGATHIVFRVRSGAAGIVAGNLVLDATARDHHLAGTVRLRNFDIAPIFPSTRQHTDVTGRARVNVGFVKTPHGTDVHGPFRLDAEQGSAFGYHARDVRAEGRIDGTLVTLREVSAIGYGSPATTAGTIQLPHDGVRVAYDLRGHAADVDLRALPASLRLPRVPSALTFDYHVAGTGSKVSGSAGFDRSTFTGATVQPGTRSTFSYGPAGLQYTASGALAGFDLRRFGRDFDIATLDDALFASAVNGHFEVSGSGTTLERLNLDARGTVRDSTLFGARVPAATFTTTIARESLDAKTSGQVRELNPAEIAGPLPSGDLAGRFDLAIGLQRMGEPRPTLADNLWIAGRVALQSSVVAGIHITSADVNGAYRNRAADINRLTATGPSIRVRASGLLSLNASAESALKYRLETPSLDRLGAIVHQPVSGAATVDGQLTGNATALETTGTLKGSNVAYGSFQALDLNGQYQVKLANLKVSDLSLTAISSATFVKAVGVQVNKVAATTTYAAGRLDFDVDARQPNRHVQAGGLVVFHPARQEVRLRHLSVESGGATWQIPAGSEALVDYGENRIAVSGVSLVNGSQQVSAGGTIGARASDLQVRLSNVQLSNIDALLLSNRHIGGVIDAQATISGPRDALQADAHVAVTHGSFRQFTYQSLDGTVNFARNRLGIHARLTENPRAWIAVDGVIPAAIFEADQTPAEAREPVDVRIESNPLDLGLVQGFTGALKDVAGTVQIDARVTGTAGDPHLGGRARMSNGAFTVGPTGVRYKDVDAEVGLQHDRVTVQTFTAADPDGHRLTISGDLAVAQRRVRGVNLRVNTSSFQVIDNRLAKASVNADLTVAGELRRPRVTGTTTIGTATVNVDRLIELTAGSPYSTTAQAAPAGGADLAATKATAQPVNEPAAPAERSAGIETGPAPLPSALAAAASVPSRFRAATIGVRISVPDDLVVKGNDIRVGQAPIGFGQVSVTLGGDVRVEKAPDASVRLFGTIATIRGTYEFQGRRFDIQRGGQLRFDGSPRVNPSLDVTATRQITGVDVRVHLGGTLRKPVLTLTSNPPLDQADVLSLIVFGQSANELGSGQQLSLAQRATALAGGFVASKLAQSIGNVLGLDTFEIQPVEGATGQLGAQVTIGGRIGQRVYVKVQRAVGGVNTSEFVLDYQLTDFLRFETTMSQGTTPIRLVRGTDRSGADLIFFFSF